MRSKKHFLGALTCALLGLMAVSATARDLTVVKDWTGRHWVYAADAAGFQRQPIPMAQVDGVEITEGLAHVVGGRTHMLFGMTAKGVKGRQIDLELGGQVAELHMGNRIAIAKGMMVTVVYVVTEERIASYFIHAQVQDIQIEGNIAYLHSQHGHFLFGPSDDKVAVQELGVGPRPSQIMMARNQAVIRRGTRIYLNYLNGSGFHVTRLDTHGQQPGNIFIGGYAGHTIGEPDRP